MAPATSSVFCGLSELRAMWFWKAFAWVALGWALVARRGAGILIRKTPAAETGESSSDATDER